MVFASAVLMLAGSPQTFLGVASAHESLFLVVEILAVYGRHVSNELGGRLAQFWRFASSSPNKRREVRQSILPFLRHQMTVTIERWNTPETLRPFVWIR
jgi:hypothetical protein